MDNDLRCIYESHIICNTYVQEEGLKGVLKSIAAAGAIGAASLFGSPSKSSTPSTPPAISHQDNGYSNIKNHIFQSEGKGKAGRPGFIYKDSRGYPTIGIGHLVTDNTPEIFRQLFGTKFDSNTVLSGRKPLTDKQMFKLLDYDLPKKINLAKSQIPEFNTYPPYVQTAIVDGYYRGDLPGSPKTKKLINSGNWVAAATEYLNNKEYKAAKSSHSGVAKRMERNRDKYLQYAQELVGQPSKVDKVDGTRDADEKQVIVKQGDTLYGIAKNMGINIKGLISANPNINPNKLQIGQKLNLPSS